MGSRMAANLLAEGYEIAVYNRTKEKADALLEKGATWVDSPRRLAEKVDVLYTMLANPQAVEAAALGEDGFLDGLKEGSIWADCSTVNPAFSRSMAKEAAKRGVRFLDAPVAGSKIPAEKGELVFVVGGNESDLEYVRPHMSAMGKAIQYQGENGKGTSMKLVINLMLAQTMAAFGEAVAFGESIGLEKETVIETLLGGPTTAPFLNGKKEKLMNHEYSAEFPLEHMQKDLQLVSQTAFENEFAMPIANITKEVYAMAKQHGYSQQDFSAIYQFLSKR